MKNKRIVLASVLAILLAPSALQSISQPDTVHAATGVGTVGVIRRAGNFVYDRNGKMISGTYLPNFTTWKLGSSYTLNGKTYYQVATNEYVEASEMDVYDANGHALNYTTRDTGTHINNPVATILHNGGTVYDSNGYATGQTLPEGSAWKLAGSNVINGATYYQVGSSEWIKASGSAVSDGVPTTNTQTTPNTSQNTSSTRTGVVTTTTNVVNANGQTNGVVLNAGSNWKLGKMISINGSYYYQIATDEYIPPSVVKTADDPSITVQNTNITLFENQTVINDNNQATGQTLPAYSTWKTNASRVVSGYRYYRVATNEWVKTVSIPALHQMSSITATLSANKAVYDQATNSWGRTLPAGSSWKITHVIKNSKGAFWGKVSTNEWLPLNEGNISLSTNADVYIENVHIDEPSFAFNF